MGLRTPDPIPEFALLVSYYLNVEEAHTFSAGGSGV
jgi:hypothetical protein